MSWDANDLFTVKIVFRGLFVASIERFSVDVLLPDASAPDEAIEKEKDPRQTLLRSLRPLREHQVAVEFYVSDWHNRSDLTPQLVELHKPTKEPVAVYLVKDPKDTKISTIEFGGLYQDAGEPPSHLKVKKKHYKKHGKLLVLEEHPEFGFDQLPRFESDIEPAVAAKCTASARAIFGEVYTERRSMRNGKERKWRGVSVLHGDYLSEADRKRLNLPAAPADLPARPINLDLVVRFALPMSNPLQVVCRGSRPTPRYFLLRPPAPGGEVTVWIKNRELDAILRDSDLLPFDPHAAMEDGDATDRDHGMYMRLAKDPIQQRVPRLDSAGVSDSGSGCGGTGKPGG